MQEGDAVKSSALFVREGGTSIQRSKPCTVRWLDKEEDLAENRWQNWIIFRESKKSQNGSSLCALDWTHQSFPLFWQICMHEREKGYLDCFPLPIVEDSGASISDRSKKEFLPELFVIHVHDRLSLATLVLFFKWPNQNYRGRGGRLHEWFKKLRHFVKKSTQSILFL